MIENVINVDVQTDEQTDEQTDSREKCRAILGPAGTHEQLVKLDNCTSAVLKWKIIPFPVTITLLSSKHCLLFMVNGAQLFCVNAAVINLTTHCIMSPTFIRDTTL